MKRVRPGISERAYDRDVGRLVQEIIQGDQQGRGKQSVRRQRWGKLLEQPFRDVAITLLLKDPRQAEKDDRGDGVRRRRGRILDRYVRGVQAGSRSLPRHIEKPAVRPVVAKHDVDDLTRQLDVPALTGDLGRMQQSIGHLDLVVQHPQADGRLRPE